MINPLNGSLRLMRRLWLVVFMLMTLAPTAAQAHKLAAYASVEDDRITVHAYFARGGKARGAKVCVHSESGKLLMETKTDQRGECSFRPPAVETLKIVIDSGDGHRRELTVDKLRLQGLAPSSGPPVPGKNAEKSQIQKSGEPATENGAGEKDDVLMQIARLKQSVNELRHEVVRMRKALNAAKVRDVAAGVGFILGLFGVGAYFLSKKDSKRSREEASREPR